jgi:hypothetical protein
MHFDDKHAAQTAHARPHFHFAADSTSRRISTGARLSKS